MQHQAFPREGTAPASRDPLALMLARQRIGRAEYLAAGQFRKHYGAGHEDQLEKCRHALGAVGMAVVVAMLIQGLSAKQIAASRGMRGQDWTRYYARLLQDCLGELARLYGFA